MKKITVLSSLITIMFLAGCTDKTVPVKPADDQSRKPGLEICPDEWIDNQEPGDEPKSEENRQYYILGGERREMSEFNVDWVRKNCNLEKQVVW